MKPEQYKQVKHLFNAALELSPDARPAFVDEACGDDRSLKSAVEKLLAAHYRADSFIETPAFDLASDLLTDHRSSLVEGQRIGPYKIVGEIGQGGMGTVYLSERADDHYHKQVAIKVVRRGLDISEIRRRFLAERQILANLDHPNIARLLDGGTTEDGLPYIVMEYVEGLPLIDYCDSHELSTIERLKLFRTVCSAVHYAHQNLVIHRDLKPCNIIVNTEGVAKLLDFGIAKVFRPDSQDQAPDVTRTELRVMTPEYASPEQIKGERATTASDIYSLGVLLYQMLTGVRPYRIKTTDPIEISRAICETQPERPSAAVSRLVGTQSRDQKPLRRQLQGDLDNIILMAMRKEALRRYSSVEQFSDDIQRYLEGRPVLARKDTFGYRAAKFIRRNKAATAAVFLIAVTLIAGIITTVWQARRASEQARIATEQRDRAQLEQVKAERINSFLQQMLAYANPSWYAPGKDKRRDLTVIEALDEASRRINTELDDQPEVKAEIHTTIGDTYRAIGRMDLAEPHFEAALKLRRELFGDHHKEVAESLYYLGGVRVLKGDATQGEQLYRDALAIQRTMPNEGNNLPYMLLDMGSLLVSKGEFVEAIEILGEAHHIFRDKHGPEHMTVAISHEYLGNCYYFGGDLETARAELEEALRLYEKNSETNTATARLRLGQIYTIREEYEKSESLLREALALYIRQHGEKHHGTLAARYSLARLALERGDYKTARQETEKAIEIDRQAYGDGSPQRAGGLTAMGYVETRMGRLARGESYLREALRLRSLGKPQTAYTMSDLNAYLGECLTAQKRFEEAEPFLIESYDSLKGKQVPHSYRLRQAQRRLSVLYERWGKPEMAARYDSQHGAEAR